MVQGTLDIDQEVPAPGAVPVATPPKSTARWVTEWAVILVVALVIALTIRTFFVQTFYIPSASMTPTLQIGDRILVDKLAYRTHGPARDDIVVFRPPPLESSTYTDLVKRVIGLPGDTVSLVDGKVAINGKVISEPYLPPGTETLAFSDGYPWDLNQPYKVPPGEYFVMGDNRENSEDSRFFGPVPRSLIVGRAFSIVWPLSRSGGL